MDHALVVSEKPRRARIGFAVDSDGTTRESGKIAVSTAPSWRPLFNSRSVTGFRLSPMDLQTAAGARSSDASKSSSPDL